MVVSKKKKKKIAATKKTRAVQHKKKTKKVVAAKKPTITEPYIKTQAEKFTKKRRVLRNLRKKKEKKTEKISETINKARSGPILEIQVEEVKDIPVILEPIEQVVIATPFFEDISTETLPETVFFPHQESQVLSLEPQTSPGIESTEHTEQAVAVLPEIKIETEQIVTPVAPELTLETAVPELVVDTKCPQVPDGHLVSIGVVFEEPSFFKRFASILFKTSRFIKKIFTDFAKRDPRFLKNDIVSE